MKCCRKLVYLNYFVTFSSMKMKSTGKMLSLLYGYGVVIGIEENSDDYVMEGGAQDFLTDTATLRLIIFATVVIFMAYIWDTYVKGPFWEFFIGQLDIQIPVATNSQETFRIGGGKNDFLALRAATVEAVDYVYGEGRELGFTKHVSRYFCLKKLLVEAAEIAYVKQENADLAEIEERFRATILPATEADNSTIAKEKASLFISAAKNLASWMEEYNDPDRYREYEVPPFLEISSSKFSLQREAIEELFSSMSEFSVLYSLFSFFPWITSRFFDTLQWFSSRRNYR